MKKLTAAIPLAFLLFFGCKEAPERPYNNGINIIPAPAELVQNEGSFNLNSSTRISADSVLNPITDYFCAKIQKSTGYSLDRKEAASDVITLSIDTALNVPSKEGYTLKVTSDKVDIVGKSAQGVFYGMQTLMQLLPAEIESQTVVDDIAWKIPAVTVRDYPRFPYRGMMLDVTRHYNDLDFIKKQIDLLAMFKINRFHWHLTDDQLWTIEIKRYPELTTIGSVRNEQDGTVHKGCFTQEQVKELVAYANERFVEVIPEIELPGHALAALSAYPQYSCTGGPFTHRVVWGVEPDVYCAGNDATFEFLQNVLTEVAPLFTSPYIHIGGDECPKDRWIECPKCQARMRAEGLKTPFELQSYFVQRIEKHVNSLGKSIIGWDEILEGGIAPSATIMSWRGLEGGITAARAGHDVIMSPGDWLYLDKYQGAAEVEPVAIGGYLTPEKTYSFDPVPAELNEQEAKHIIGVQANIWTEYMYEPGAPEYFIYPRIFALAEIGWTPLAVKNYDDFERRIDNALVRLDGHDVNYHIPMPEGPLSDRMVFTDSLRLGFGNTRDYPMVYTLDGTTPDKTSSRYTDTLCFDADTTLKIATLLPSGKTSRIRTIEIVKELLMPAVKAESTPGMLMKETTGLYLDTTAMEDAKWSDPVVVNEFVKTRVESTDYKTPWVKIYEGYFEVPESGVYTVTTDQYVLYIDGRPVIVNDGKVATRHLLNKKTIALESGKHRFTLIVNNRNAGGWPYTWSKATFFYKSPSQTEFADVSNTTITH